MRVRFRILMPGVRKRRKTARHQARENLTVGRRAAVRPPACLMTSDPHPPGEDEADAHCLIRQRERAEYPQLRDIHRIYESVVLGMHPASLYPRRSRIAPKTVGRKSERT